MNGGEDAVEGRIGHGQDYVAGDEKRAERGELCVGEVIQEAKLHLHARVGGGTDANYGQRGAIGGDALGLPEFPGAAFGGIVGGAAAEDGDFVGLGECADHRLRYFCGGGGVGREIQIQQQNAHGQIVQGRAQAAFVE